MAKSAEVKKAEVKQFFIDEGVRETNRRGRTVSVEDLRPDKVPYATFAAIVRGQQLPSWDNAITLVSKWPHLAKILEIPAFLAPEIANNPLALDIMKGLYELAKEGKDQEVAELKSMLERMQQKAKVRKNGAESPV